MGPFRDTLTGADLRLLHEALAYLVKRVHEPAESIRLRGLLERVEEMLVSGGRSPASLRLSPPEQRLLEREIPVYCEALTQRGGSIEGAREADRLRLMVGIRKTGSRRPWWRKVLGR